MKLQLQPKRDDRAAHRNSPSHNHIKTK